MASLSAATLGSYAMAILTYTPSTTTPSYNGVTYSVDLFNIAFLSNTYSANLFTGGKALVHLEGAPRVSFSTETFTNNGDMSSDALTLYGTNIMSPSSTEMSISSSISSPGTYLSSSLGQSLITVKRSISVSLSSMTYTNNWKIETDYGTRA